MSDTAQLHFEGKVIELPIIEGTEKEKAVDISKLRGQTGLITMDAGFKNTGSTTSGITFLDGEKGILRHRGYALEDLASKASFLEVGYLLIHGELPTEAQLSEFEGKVIANSLVPESIVRIIEQFPQDAHPMGILAAVTSAMTAFFPESIDPSSNPEAIEDTVIKLIGTLPVVSAMIYKHSIGEPITQPTSALDYSGNFLNMMFANPVNGYEVDPVVANALDQLLILHADHEQNCSTSTVRVVGSSQASLYASISAGICALWGKSHGGANQAVIEMLEDIKNDGGDTEKFLAKAKDKNDPFRLMGFGHRVYKNFDPRARIIKKAADEVLNKLGVDNPTLEVAKKLEAAALSDSYFADRKLYPNVDFYSGIIYRAMGIPVEMFTVLFAIGRLPGWIAQWIEMRNDGHAISRPRQVYTGYTLRDFKEKSAR